MTKLESTITLQTSDSKLNTKYHLSSRTQTPGSNINCGCWRGGYSGAWHHIWRGNRSFQTYENIFSAFSEKLSFIFEDLWHFKIWQCDDRMSLGVALYKLAACVTVRCNSSLLFSLFVCWKMFSCRGGDCDKQGRASTKAKSTKDMHKVDEMRTRTLYGYNIWY